MSADLKSDHGSKKNWVDIFAETGRQTQLTIYHIPKGPRHSVYAFHLDCHSFG